MINTVFVLQSTGLIKLPTGIELNDHIQPIQLPTECGDDLENIDVIAIGAGLTQFAGRLKDVLLRRAYLETMSADDCRDHLNDFNKPDSVICAPPNDNEQCVSHGDSGKTDNKISIQEKRLKYEISIAGGPLLRRSNGSLIGVASFINGNVNEKPLKITHQVFTKVHVYYDWIREVTGLDLPNCVN